MINRRKFVTLCSGLAACGLTLPREIGPARVSKAAINVSSTPLVDNRIATRKTRFSPPITDLHPDAIIADNLLVPETEAPRKPKSDVVLNNADRIIFNRVVERLARLQSHVGYGNFNVIGWDKSLRIARNSSQVGGFSKAELEFIEKIFFTNAADLGFYGNKVITRISTTIPSRDIVKIPGSGHFLFKGEAADTYQKIRRDVGDSIRLTSGIRSVVKQIHLFLNKTARVDGNLSIASYSLAPPGHSYHALGDFDVGKKGFGHKNFSAEFAQTDEFKRLSDLGYVDIRYPQNNPFGVRYEPWHIKVV